MTSPYACSTIVMPRGDSTMPNVTPSGASFHSASISAVLAGDPGEGEYFLHPRPTTAKPTATHANLILCLYLSVKAAGDVVLGPGFALVREDLCGLVIL